MKWSNDFIMQMSLSWPHYLTKVPFPAIVMLGAKLSMLDLGETRKHSPHIDRALPFHSCPTKVKAAKNRKSVLGWALQPRGLSNFQFSCYVELIGTPKHHLSTKGTVHITVHWQEETLLSSSSLLKCRKESGGILGVGTHPSKDIVMGESVLVENKCKQNLQIIVT